jgi:hypothetical protein
MKKTFWIVIRPVQEGKLYETSYAYSTVEEATQQIPDKVTKARVIPIEIDVAEPAKPEKTITISESDFNNALLKAIDPSYGSFVHPENLRQQLFGTKE